MDRRQIERQKIRECATMVDGFGGDVTVSAGLVVMAGDSLDIGGHGLLVPWMGDLHIKIVVSAE